jgi:hypothetical protein
MILCDVLWDEPKLMCCGGVVDLEKVVVMAELDLKHTDALGWPDAWWHMPQHRITITRSDAKIFLYRRII